ncbi:MAG: hypothetical protein ACOH17_06745 [Cellulomonas sp.]
MKIVWVEMMREIFAGHGIPRVVHADRGISMTYKAVAAVLSDLAVAHCRFGLNPILAFWFAYVVTRPPAFGYFTSPRAGT